MPVSEAALSNKNFQPLTSDFVETGELEEDKLLRVLGYWSSDTWYNTINLVHCTKVQLPSQETYGPRNTRLSSNEFIPLVENQGRDSDSHQETFILVYASCWKFVNSSKDA